MNLIDVSKQFANEDQCLDYIEAMRWPDGIVRCPTCGNDKISRIERKATSKNRRNRFYQCLEPTCKQQFSATSGTIFNDTHLPLTKWFMGVAIVLNAKKGVSALQLQRDLGIGSYRTAWYLYHRIREAMQDNEGLKLTDTVEIDETYIGGKQRGHRGKLKNKDAVIGMRQRGGLLKLVRVEDTKQGTVYEAIAQHVDRSVKRIITDESRVYNFKLTQYMHATHQRVNHIAGEYVRRDVYTNTIENAFSLLKRAWIGTYHQLSIKHLQRYLNEFSYRFNRRDNPDAFIETVRRIAGFKPLPYAALIATSEKA